MSRTATLASVFIGILFASNGLTVNAQRTSPATAPVTPSESIPRSVLRTVPGAIAPLSPKSEIPRDYESWSLFLICNPKWILDKGDQGIADLYKAFNAFGDAIGANNVAVWFLKDKGQPPTVANTDINRMSSYCHKYHLLPSKTPQVIVTTSFPDDPNVVNRAILNLGSSASDSEAALNDLTDQLLKTGLNQAGLDEKERWRRFIAAGAAATSAVGCYMNKVSLSFNVGFAKGEIVHSNDKGCKPSG
jgi:hypothetical protein